jgi:hypothetical protein
MAVELGVHEGSQLGVDGRQHLGGLLDQRDCEAALREGLRHLEPDVACADDDRASRPAEGTVERKGVLHRVQQVDAGQVEPGEARADRRRAGGDDQGVVVELAGAVRHSACVRIDGRRRVVEPQRHAGALELGAGAVREVIQLGQVPGEQVGDPADRVVRIRFGDEHGDLAGGVELAGSQRGGDAGVTTADDHQSHRTATPARSARRAGRRRPLLAVCASAPALRSGGGR